MLKDLRTWLACLIAGIPHFVIGGEDDPYMLRWFVIPRNKIFNIYVHKFLRDDDPRALHDHPWWFISLILKGGYYEVVPDPVVPKAEIVYTRQAGSLAFRKATHKHRVVMLRSQQGYEMLPCWTLVITGRKVRSWGFWCPQGFVNWKEFTSPTEGGNQIGRGCE